MYNPTDSLTNQHVAMTDCLADVMCVVTSRGLVSGSVRVVSSLLLATAAIVSPLNQPPAPAPQLQNPPPAPAPQLHPAPSSSSSSAHSQC